LQDKWSGWGPAVINQNLLLLPNAAIHCRLLLLCVHIASTHDWLLLLLPRAAYHAHTLAWCRRVPALICRSLAVSF
jgi:hypothetical protein